MNQQDIIREIRQKNDIVDIISEKIPLVARGKNYFGVCPFHDDTNPSMSVSREKQIYTCFSCHATGNVFNFLMDYEHKEFREVLKELADRVGIPLAGYHETKKTTKYDAWYDIYNLALKYYQNNLMSGMGKDARNYLENRSINEEIIKKFELGWSLDDNNLTNLLIKKGYTIDLLNQVGLSTGNNDLYRNRLMFPLHDLNGRVIGFSGRIITNSKQNKYLNTKETELFKKGKLLYHYHIAKEAVRISKNVIIMEGFMDIIRASIYGFDNTIATMGTALTKDHISNIKRLSPNIILCFDGDEAGQKATMSAGNLFGEAGIEVKVIELPLEDDPDSFLLSRGKDAFASLINSAIFFKDYKIKRLKNKVNFASSEEKADYIHKVLEETKEIDDPIRIEIILKDLAKNFEIGYNTLEKSFQELKDQKEITTFKIVETKAPTERLDKYQKASYALLSYMIDLPWVIDDVEEAHLVFPNSKLRILENEIVAYYRTNGFINWADFYTYLGTNEELLKLLSEIGSYPLKKEVSKEEISSYESVILDYSRKQQIKRLNKKLLDTTDPLEQARIAEEIRKLRIGEKQNGK